ncbi:MAG: LamG-like jellyroll fold domain-containing protein, partial [Pseudomonadota bacterium]
MIKTFIDKTGNEGESRLQKSKISEGGNVFFAMFGAVALVGALGVTATSIIQGPMKTMAEVSQRAEAEAEIMSNMSLAALSVSDMTDQDCDLDGIVEPEPWDAGTGPTGGGLLPTAIRTSNINDPWNTQYGYCVWDHGTAIDAAGCGGGAQNRLQGADPTGGGSPVIAEQTVYAIISAGADRTFETVCSDFVDANTDGDPDTPLVQANGDDLVMMYNYAEASIATSSNWRLSAGTNDTAGDSTAELDQSVELAGDQVQLGTTGTDTGLLDLSQGGLGLPQDPGDDSLTGACVNGGLNDKQLRINTSTTPNSLEICTGGAWTQLGDTVGTGGSTTSCTNYFPNAVNFDGTNDYLTANNISGAVDSKQWSGSVWFKLNETGAMEIFDTDESSAGGDHSVLLQQGGASDTIRIEASNSSNTRILTATHDDNINYNDGNWHHLMWSFDLSDGTQTNAHILVDGNPNGLTINTWIDDFIDLDTSTSDWVYIGRAADGSLWRDHDLADYWMDFGTYIDLSDSSNLALFYNSATGSAPYLGADGSLPTGSAPDIFLSGDTDNWHTNKGSGGGFTENGALTGAGAPDGTVCSSSSCNTYTPNPVHFDTGDYVEIAGGLSNTPDSGMLTMSFWMYPIPFSTFVPISGEFPNVNRMRVYRETNDRLQMVMENSSGAMVLNARTGIGSLEHNTWNHVVFSLDLSDADKFHIFINGVDQAVTPTTYTVGQTIDFNYTSDFRLGGDGSDSDHYFADYWYDPGTYIDLSNPSNLEKFITSDGKPVFLGYDGSAPTGEKPDIFLSGPTNGWHGNMGTGGVSAENGALTDAPTPITQGINCENADVTDGLIGHWKLDDTSGSTILDYSGNENDGTWGDGTGNDVTEETTDGIIGNALDFDGSDDHVELGQIGDWRINNNTTSMWIRAESINGSDQNTFLGFGQYDYRFEIDGQGHRCTPNAIRLDINSSYWLCSTTLAEIGTWYHVAASMNHDTETVTLYVNGVAEDINTTHLQNLDVAQHPNSGTDLGRRESDNDQEFHGQMDDVRIYDRVLTPDEIKILASGVQGSIAGDGVAYEENFTTNQTVEQATAFDATDGVSLLKEYGTVITRNSDDHAAEAGIGFLVGATPANDDEAGAAISAVRLGGNGATGLAFKTQGADGELKPRAFLDPDGDLGIGVSVPSDVGAKVQIRDTGNGTWSSTYNRGLLVNPGLDTVTAIISDGLIGYWELDETSGTTAEDSSGNGHDGTYVSIDPATDSIPGQVENAIPFIAANNEYVRITDHPDFDLTSYTLSSWVRGDNPSDESGSPNIEKIVSKDFNFILNWDHSVQGGASCEHWSGSVWETTGDAPDLSADTWYHLACTYDSASQDFIFYVNGIETNRSTSVPGAQLDGQDVLIGRWQLGDGSHNINADIDDVRIYNRALSADE